MRGRTRTAAALEAWNVHLDAAEKALETYRVSILNPTTDATLSTDFLHFTVPFELGVHNLSLYLPLYRFGLVKGESQGGSLEWTIALKFSYDSASSFGFGYLDGDSDFYRASQGKV